MKKLLPVILALTFSFSSFARDLEVTSGNQRNNAERERLRQEIQINKEENKKRKAEIKQNREEIKRDRERLKELRGKKGEHGNEWQYDQGEGQGALKRKAQEINTDNFSAQEK